MMSLNFRSRPLMLCMLALVLIVADQSWAQQRRRSMRFYGDTYSVGVALLQVEKVRAGLKLNSDQIKKATEIAEKLGEQRREVYSGLSREEWRSRGDELRKKTAAMARTAAMAIAESLDDAQKKRWREIALQVHGPAALPGEELAEHLQLTNVQVKKLHDLSRAQREKMFEMFRQSQGQNLSREEREARFTALTKETNKSRLAVLTDEQKAAFKELQGEKFELPED
jgi:Spy/CpxP family protein refolding chaperone